MDTRNETYSRHCLFLNETYFLQLYDAFIAAFADYVMPFDLSEQQFRNHIILNAVDLESSLGVIEDERLIGFTLNGFGMWNNARTVYDAGTGVLPEYRRRGWSMTMFDIMLPLFKARGIGQYLLEVVTTNTNAINLYKKLDFSPSRTLSLLQCEGALKEAVVPLADGITVSDIDKPDWDHLTTFWDGEPSWQNSIDAITRSRMNKTFLGAFRDGKCVGYIVYSSSFGRVAQLAVDRSHRRCGIATHLLQRMIADMREGYIPQVINIDCSMEDSMVFFTNRGFTERLSQFEMTKFF